ncbi:MAG: hypothetical protein IPN59_16080 [Holophaga sp.]|nr:hypothetical protein [Holophaga sp.]
MPEKKPQSYATHRRFDLWFHVGAMGLLTAAFVIACILAVRRFDLASVWGVVLSLGLLILMLRVRIYALRVQDRIIRLEETLRMRALMPEAWHVRLRELTPGQFVGLRFASDEELPVLVQQALDEKLSSEAIKKRIRIWRGDTFRV